MASPFQIPWAPPDLGPGASFISSILQQNRANDRADAYLRSQEESVRYNQERQSHEDVLKEEARKRREAIEAYNAMPAILRAAHRSVGMANANPYGVKVEESFQQPDQTKADAAIGGFINADQTPRESAAPTRQLMPGEEGPEQDPAAEAARFATPEDLMDKATTGAPLDIMSQAAASSFAPPTRRLSASYQGQRFEVPEQSDTTGLGPKYDAIYQRALQEPGVTPEEAFKFVMKMAHEDAVEVARDRRAEESEAGRDRRFEGYHLTVADEFEKQRRALEQSDKNSRRAAAAGGGIVRSPALQSFVSAANDLRPGEPISPQVADLGLKAGFKPNQIAAEADRYRNSDVKSAKGAGGVLSLKEIAPLNVSITNIDKLISQIESNPKAWDEYRDSAERWKRNEGMRGNWLGQGLQGIGVMNVSPEQGLTTSEGKKLFQRQETLDIDIAKSFGGVITEGDRDAAKAKQANFALNAREKLEGLRELRDSLAAKRDTFLQTTPGAAGGATRSVRMPDGSVQKFDASGKRIE